MKGGIKAFDALFQLARSVAHFVCLVKRSTNDGKNPRPLQIFFKHIFLKKVNIGLVSETPFTSVGMQPNWSTEQ